MKQRLSLVVLGVAVFGGAAVFAHAAEPKADLAGIRKDLQQVGSSIGKRQYEEAAKELDAVQRRLREVMRQEKLDEKARPIVQLRRQIERYRKLLAGKSGAAPSAATVSFAKDVAPLLASRCFRCHGQGRTSGGLSMASYASLTYGGRSGPVILAGKPEVSLLARRIQGLDQKPRMPREGEPLSDADIKKIATWIAEGAKFDGRDASAALSSFAGGNAPSKRPPVDVSKLMIARPQGNETVRFVKDVAPTFVNICSGCHNANRDSGGLSVETFADLLQGGDDGPVIVPGKPEESLLFALIKARSGPVQFKELRKPRMPAGNRAPLPEATVARFETWIAEGAKYDAESPTAALRSLVPTEEDMLRAKLAAMSPGELTAYRLERAREAWRQANPREKYAEAQREHFVLLGNTKRSRLEQLAGWAEEQYQAIGRLLGAAPRGGRMAQNPLEHGKLVVFVFADRFAYSEQGRMVEGREIARGVEGHWRITAGDAYVCVQDTGDEADPGTHARLAEQLSGAFLQVWGEGKLPPWVVQGTASVLGARVNRRATAYHDWPRQAWESLSASTNPAELLADGADTPAPLSHCVLGFLLERDERRFGAFLRNLKETGNVDRALAGTYRLDRATLLRQWAAQMAAR